MTARERRVAEFAAQDLEGWARELPLGSQTRRDLQETARAYRFIARAGARPVPLRAVPDTGLEEEAAAGLRGTWTRGDRPPETPVPAEAPRALGGGL